MIGGIVLTMMLVMALSTLTDEVVAIGEDANATRYDVMLQNTFPPLLAVMALCSAAATIYWMWKD